MKTEKLYQNKDWLGNKYIKEELSISKIAILCGVVYSTIHNWLCKFGIPIRSKSEGIRLILTNHCDLSLDAIEWINGELLGDGCLQSCSPCSARFQYASKYFEYCQYIKNTLESFGIKGGRINKRYKKEINCYYYDYKSYSYGELLTIKEQWYPNGKKIVPKDIELTPLTCRQWYIGDGSLIHGKKGRPYIRLATINFLVKDVKWLVTKLNKLNFKATEQPGNNKICISAYSTEDFLNYIGFCPVRCYEYKWSYN